MSTTKDLVIEMLRAVEEKSKTAVEIAKTTNTTEAFTAWIINGKRYGYLFTKTIPSYNPAQISPSPKGRQFLTDAADNKENPL